MGGETPRNVARQNAGEPAEIHDRLTQADRSSLHTARSRKYGLRARPKLSRYPALYARRSPYRLPSETLDDAPVCRIRLSVRYQSAIQVSARTWADGPLDGIRSADIDGL